MYKKIVKEHLNFEKKKDTLSSLNIGKRKLIEDWLDEMFVINYIINDDFTIDVDDDVDLYNKDLKEFPEYIKFGIIEGNFYCSRNELMSLRGCPDIVKCDFICNNNDLSTLEGCPKIVTFSFFCSDKRRKFTEEYVRSLCNVGEIVVISF
jgi:hypothetical protein